MSREKLLNGIGFGLLALCFVVSLGRISIARLTRALQPGEKEPVELRLAHWQLEGGVRQALDEIARQYMERHPHVKIVQIPVPERIFKNWLITQLVGETPPDLIEISGSLTAEKLARYFVPLGEIANSPNPYNRGTELETVPLRETLFDGMQGGFNPILLEYYGVPISTYTIRMFYNLDLLKKITGSEKLPETYEELQQLCAQCWEYARKTGETVVPIAGSRSNGPRLMQWLFASQTQRMLLDKVNDPGLVTVTPRASAVGQAYLRGRWSFRSPEVRSGSELMSAMGRHMQPGFMQLQRDDASFYFVQGRALMIATGTWDASSLLSLAPFRLDANAIPIPETDHPRYGAYTFGAVSEASQNAALAFGLTRASKHPEQALDFLQFLASKPMNKVWTDSSRWPPAVVGVEAVEEAQKFLPRAGGYPPGFTPLSPGADSRRFIDNNMHLLFRHGDGGVEDFLSAMEKGYDGAVRSDLRRSVRVAQDNLQRADTMAGTLSILGENDSAAARKLDLLIQSNLENERMMYESQAVLAEPTVGQP